MSLPWIFVVGSWLALAALFVGIGHAAWPLCFRTERRSVHLAFWLGWLGTIVFLQLWHLLFAVDGRVYFALAPVALFGWVSWKREQRLSFDWLRPDVAPFLAVSIAFVAWAAVRALGPAWNLDTCLYFVQTIRWIEAYPIVRGLGNLHHGLGFNHSYYLYAALVDSGPFKGRGQHLGNGLLYLPLGLRGIWSTSRLLSKQKPVPSDLLWAVILAVTLDQVLWVDISSPSADGGLWALNSLIAAIALGPALDRVPWTAGAVRFTILAAVVAVSVKSLTVFVAAPFTLWVVWNALRVAPKTRISSLLGWATAVGVAAGLPWIGRGLISSGYPLYPSTVGNLKFPWRIPEVDVRHIGLFARAFARFRSSSDYVHVQDYPWVRHWLSVEWLDDRVFLIPVVGIGCAALVLAFLALRAHRVPAGWPSLLPSCASLLFWWLVAPEPRFLGPREWILFAQFAILVGDFAASPQALRVFWACLALLVQGGAFWSAYPGVSADHFAPLPPERYQWSRMASGEPVHLYDGCCLEIPCGSRLEHQHLRRPGDWSSGLFSDLVE